MHILLIHNPDAGHADDPDHDLPSLIRAAGHNVRVENKKSDFTPALLEPADLVVIAGGDGSVSKVAGAIMDTDRLITILPVGTANNLARSLGIAGEPRELIAGWGHGYTVALDAGIATHPSGRTVFFESAGFGLFTEAMCLAKSHGDAEDKFTPEERFDRDFRLLRRLAGSLVSQHCTIDVDGEVIHAEAVLCEIMNSRQIGSRLVLAPNADTGDGLLDLVLVTAPDRAVLESFLQRDPADDHGPHLPVVRGRRFHITSRVERIHLGDSIERFPVTDQPWTLDIEVRPAAVQVLVPRL